MTKYSVNVAGELNEGTVYRRRGRMTAKWGCGKGGARSTRSSSPQTVYREWNELYGRGKGRKRGGWSAGSMSSKEASSRDACGS
jgi:hypothetical protein